MLFGRHYITNVYFPLTYLAHLRFTLSRISICFSSLVLITGFYRVALATILKSKLNAEKKKRQEEEEKKEMNFEELKQSHARKDKQIAQRDEQIAQQDAQIERLRRDLKTAHTLLHDGDSGCVTVYMCVCVCWCVC